MKRVAVIGSRTATNVGMIQQKLDIMLAHYKSRGIPVTIVTGGAAGADAAAMTWAFRRQCLLNSYPANWEQFGRGAGMKRNAHIIAGCDVVIAFWDGRSPGTRNALQRARSAKKRIYVFDLEGNLRIKM